MKDETTQYPKLNTEDIRDTLVDLGFNLNDRGPYWQTTAIWRNGDNPTAVQIYKDSGVWKDYVEQSGPQPFVKLIAKVLGTYNSKVIQKYIKKDGQNQDFLEETGSKVTIKMQKTYESDILEKFLPHHKFYTDKNISLQTIKLYQGGYCTFGKMNGRYVFPIFQKQDPSKIIGFTGRYLRFNSNTTLPKWKHEGLRKSWLYPLYIPVKGSLPFLEEAKEKKEIIIVESIGDSLALTENKMKNHLVTFGLGLSSDQICELVSLSPDKIIISPNNDSGGESNAGLESAIKDFVKLLDFFDISKLQIKLPISNDLSDSHVLGTFDHWAEKSPRQSLQIEHVLKKLESHRGKFIIKNAKTLQSKINFLKEHLGDE